MMVMISNHYQSLSISFWSWITIIDDGNVISITSNRYKWLDFFFDYQWSLSTANIFSDHIRLIRDQNS